MVKQLPGLIQENEPMIESNLRAVLLKMTPEDGALFLEHWQKLDRVVQDTLRPTPVDVGGKKRTRLTKRKKRHTKR